MKDPTLVAALRSVGRRPFWVPSFRDYPGDRPNLVWPEFLKRVNQSALNTAPRFLRSTLPSR